jgi:hypothetical protein
VWSYYLPSDSPSGLPTSRLAPHWAARRRIRARLRLSRAIIVHYDGLSRPLSFLHDPRSVILNLNGEEVRVGDDWRARRGLVSSGSPARSRSPSHRKAVGSLVAYPTIPPIALIHPAISAMTPECARTNGRATPLTRNMAVTKWPKSTGPDEYSALKSSPTHLEQMKLGRGARAKMRAV